MAEQKDSVDLICSVAELSGLFANSHDLRGFLQQVVSMVAAHMHAAVCSVYLYDEEAEELVLSATHGLNPEAIGKTRLKVGEGITGMAFKELRPVREEQGNRNPYFKFIPGTNEEQYSAFLAVPIVHGLTRIGMLVVQDVRHGFFDETDTKALRAIASQLAGTIENARMLMALHPGGNFASAAHKEEGTPSFYKGSPGAAGIARGPAVNYGRLQFGRLEAATATIRADRLTLDDFERAMVRTERELEEIEEGMKDAMADVAASMIFSAHLLMLKDESFAGEIRHRIEAGTGVLDAIRDVVIEFSHLFEASPNARVKEKTQDIQDLGLRLIENLAPEQTAAGHYAGRIVLAADLLPSEMLKIAAQKAAGMILTKGSFTAHLAILARSIRMPMVILTDERALTIPEGVDLLLDANQGTVYINPGTDVLRQYEEIEEVGDNLDQGAEDFTGETRTRDGERVLLLANINLLSELEIAKRMGAEGVGLYRSEFPYLVRNDFPSEEEQYRIYRKLVEEMAGRPVAFRTLDIGGDKMLSYFPSINEENPFLGLRAIRFSLRYKGIFVQQLRAFLRAGSGEDIGIMFPLVSCVDDFVRASDIVRECIGELQQEQADFNSNPRLGAMVELPSAVAVAHELARRADFLCLGTNDLIQYMLAIDRTNAAVAEHYLSHHPAVLRALNEVAKAAADTGTDLSICGEMASDPGMLPFLIGIGIRKLSLDTRKIIPTREAIAKIDTAAAKQHAHKLLRLGTLHDIEAALAEASP